MNVQEAAGLLFPDAAIPLDQLDEGQLLVSGLPKHARPRNCEVLASGQFQYNVNEAYCDSYLVRTGPMVLLVRMIPEAPDSTFAQLTVR